MGQKVSPIGFRLALTKKWQSTWFANKQEFGHLLTEDRMIRDYLRKKTDDDFIPGSNPLTH